MLGIACIFAYQSTQNIYSNSFNNPLWFLLVSTLAVHSFLDSRVNREVEESSGVKHPGPYYKKIRTALISGAIAGSPFLFLPFGSFTPFLVVVGAITSITLLILSINYYFAKKRYDKSLEQNY